MPKKNKILNQNSGIYFRSNGNNWSLSNEFLDLGNGSYVARNVNISKGLNEFKIADSNWSTNCNFGYSSEKPVMLYHNYFQLLQILLEFLLYRSFFPFLLMLLL